MEQKYLDVFEWREWRVREDESGVELEWFTPAGEDYLVNIDTEDQSITGAVFDAYMDFDVEDHVRMWLNAKADGVSGVPDIDEPVKDAHAIEGELRDLYNDLEKAREEE